MLSHRMSSPKLPVQTSIILLPNARFASDPKRQREKKDFFETGRSGGGGREGSGVNRGRPPHSTWRVRSLAFPRFGCNALGAGGVGKDPSWQALATAWGDRAQGAPSGSLDGVEATEWAQRRHLSVQPLPGEPGHGEEGVERCSQSTGPQVHFGS